MKELSPEPTDSGYLWWQIAHLRQKALTAPANSLPKLCELCRLRSGDMSMLLHGKEMLYQDHFLLMESLNLMFALSHPKTEKLMFSFDGKDFSAAGTPIEGLSLKQWNEAAALAVMFRWKFAPMLLRSFPDWLEVDSYSREALMSRFWAALLQPTQDEEKAREEAIAFLRKLNAWDFEDRLAWEVLNTHKAIATKDHEKISDYFWSMNWNLGAHFPGLHFQCIATRGMADILAIASLAVERVSYDYSCVPILGLTADLILPDSSPENFWDFFLSLRPWKREGFFGQWFVDLTREEQVEVLLTMGFNPDGTLGRRED